WQLEIDAVMTRWRSAGVDIQLPTTALEVQPGGRRMLAGIGAQALTVVVADRACAGAGGRLPYPHSVSVTAGGRAHAGCGGDPASLLQGRDWVVHEIDGQAIGERARPTLSFGRDGRVVGNASCNRYDTGYRLGSAGLVVDKPADALAACAPALMVQEAAFLAALRGVHGFEIGADGSLALTAAEGRRIVARPGSRPDRQ
ncbi:MAG: META domain-containing protein, partial [Rubrivivax sp.]|nr:META domain-containing protein [Rubrivivax sp.]